VQAQRHVQARLGHGVRATEPERLARLAPVPQMRVRRVFAAVALRQPGRAEPHETRPRERQA
jgi:hypothetical protein